MPGIPIRNGQFLSGGRSTLPGDSGLVVLTSRQDKPAGFSRLASGRQSLGQDATREPLDRVGLGANKKFSPKSKIEYRLNKLKKSLYTRGQT
jgi:hypothetical protein